MNTVRDSFSNLFPLPRLEGRSERHCLPLLSSWVSMAAVATYAGSLHADFICLVARLPVLPNASRPRNSPNAAILNLFLIYLGAATIGSPNNARKVSKLCGSISPPPLHLLY